MCRVIDIQKTESEKHRSAARRRRAAAIEQSSEQDEDIEAIVGVYASHSEVRCRICVIRLLWLVRVAFRKLGSRSRGSGFDSRPGRDQVLTNGPFTFRTDEVDAAQIISTADLSRVGFVGVNLP